MNHLFEIPGDEMTITVDMRKLAAVRFSLAQQEITLEVQGAAQPYVMKFKDKEKFLRMHEMLLAQWRNLPHH